MAEHGNGISSPDLVQQMVVHKLVIQWVPSTGQVQFACSLNDEVAQLGLLEMAKMALIEKKVRAITGVEENLIVPGRFAS